MRVLEVTRRAGEFVELHDQVQVIYSLKVHYND